MPRKEKLPKSLIKGNASIRKADIAASGIGIIGLGSKRETSRANAITKRIKNFAKNVELIINRY